ncbi:MAG: GNAT family N-acetyltransferase [Prolixibacteraceae bacterium]|nr:GNAT family N-acetyltransferase [Prolixibacteraceae bacterium]
MIIRKAVYDDWAVIAEFQVAMALETENLHLDRSTVEKGVKAVFKNPSKGIYFVGEKDNKVVGSLMITFEWSDWRNGNVWWIQSVYVVPEARREGIFKKLYLHVKEIVISDPGLRGLRLYAEKSNYIAHHTYHSLGMDSSHYDMFEWMKQSD